ncbi:MFS transporter [Mesorhizobium sp. M1A.F.Ca.ET.072.01.1.1]|uniref:MFS transporter n=1 Tax=Mesorhizobium sp. M1A.F.Ca.ET.072.01.1.1 TaxID=2496753 RepID=UPI00167A0C3F|nr:MFS transporter [Mesorhizobium sp. M1A.F.Ca.ET.072.01.1.1]
MKESSTPPLAIQNSRLFCSLFFLGGGVGIGAWASSLPVLSVQMNLDKGQLGLVLICFALGAIAMMTNVGRLVAIVPSNVLSLSGSVTFGAALLALPYAGGARSLALIVFFGGAGFGTLDVSMNTDASALERLMRRQVMSSFHAAFSFGSLAGAFVVGKILSRGGALNLCLGVTGICVALVALVAWSGWNRSSWIHSPPAAAETGDAQFHSTFRTHLFLLGGLAFLGMLAEGGMMDWSAIYIVTRSGGAESTGAYGFAAFATMMALGRLFGDAIVNRIGQMRMLRYCAAVCAGSVVAMILMGGNLAVVLAALTICGLGLANIVPHSFCSRRPCGRPVCCSCHVNRDDDGICWTAAGAGIAGADRSNLLARRQLRRHRAGIRFRFFFGAVPDAVTKSLGRRRQPPLGRLLRGGECCKVDSATSTPTNGQIKWDGDQ